jgi:hypothetical protein
MSNETSIRLYQFNKDLNLPIYVKYDAQVLDGNIAQFLVGVGFSELKEKELDAAYDNISSDSSAKLLTINHAQSNAARQIESALESDRFGAESITPKDGHRIYRYKKHAILIFSHAVKEWEMGVYQDFGSQNNILAYRSIMNRFLSWSLAPLGIIGFWGGPIDEGLVVLKQLESNGEAVFIDIRKSFMITIDGVVNLPGRFEIVRLDPHLKGRTKRMATEELLSFLSTYTTYIDYNGLSIPIRQLIRSLSKSAFGSLHPIETFKPRTDLSL